MRFCALAVLAACSHGGAGGSALVLRGACDAASYWDGTRCAPRGDAQQRLATSTQALAELRLDDVQVALDAAEQAGPLDHQSHITLWEQRGITAAYLDDEGAATRAFDMLLALDPAHFVSYALSPKATLVFEGALEASRKRDAPGVDVNWERTQRVGDAIPVDVEILADPKQFLHRATLFVRTRGEASWRAADLELAGVRDRRVVLPAIDAPRSTSLEIYLRAYDNRGNEVLAWADAARPREIALRYDPPPPWYRRWWGISSIVGVSALVVGGIVYAVTLAPPDKIDGTVTVQ